MYPMTLIVIVNMKGLNNNNNLDVLPSKASIYHKKSVNLPLEPIAL